MIERALKRMSYEELTNIFVSIKLKKWTLRPFQILLPSRFRLSQKKTVQLLEDLQFHEWKFVNESNI